MRGEAELREVRIGLIAPITGLPEFGRSSVEAANLFVQEINESGGLKVGDIDYKVVLLVEDSEFKADVAASKAHKLINQLDVMAIIGPQTSLTAIPASRVAVRIGPF